MGEQLVLDLDLATEEPRGVTFVQVCHLCGESVSEVPQDDVSAPWMASVLWCYVAQKQHERDVHGREALDADPS